MSSIFYLQGSVLQRPLLVKFAVAQPHSTQLTLFESLDNWEPALGNKQLLLPRSEVTKPKKNERVMVPHLFLASIPYPPHPFGAQMG
jgi:hypothetical protein